LSGMKEQKQSGIILMSTGLALLISSYIPAVVIQTGNIHGFVILVPPISAPAISLLLAIELVIVVLGSILISAGFTKLTNKVCDDCSAIVDDLEKHKASHKSNPLITLKITVASYKSKKNSRKNHYTN